MNRSSDVGKRQGSGTRATVVMILALSVFGLVGLQGPANADAPDLRSHRVGFGAGVDGGAAAATTWVTDCGDAASDPAPGTLRAALAVPGPRVVRWQQGCTTHLVAALNVPSGTTLDGSGQSVTLTGQNDEHDGVVIAHVSNVIVHDLTITDFGSPSLRAKNDPPNGINVIGSDRVWIDHNTFANVGNKQLAIMGGTTNVTVSWNRFVGDAYAAQFVQIGDVFDGQAVDSAQTVTSTHNLFAGLGYRTPAISYGTLHQFNDVVEGWTAYGVNCQRSAQCYLESDVFVGSGLKSGRVAVKYNAIGNGCNDFGKRCDDTWGAGTVVSPYVTARHTVIASSVATPACASPPVAPCSPLYGSGPATFTPTYPYSPEVAGAALRARVEAGAGAHVAPAW